MATGFAVGGGRVVTVAHVLARRRRRARGRPAGARRCAWTGGLDLAVLAVPRPGRARGGFRAAAPRVDVLRAGRPRALSAARRAARHRHARPRGAAGARARRGRRARRLRRAGDRRPPGAWWASSSPAPEPARPGRSTPRPSRAWSAGPGRRVGRTRWFTHQITGVGLGAVGAAAMHVPGRAAAVLVASAWLGSLLPDADRAGARLYRRTRVERRHGPVRALGALARLPLRALVLLPHRGPTHSPAGGALAAALAGLLVARVAPGLAVAAAAGIAVGWLAHVAADACTPGGVPLHWPLSRRRRWLVPPRARIPTGSLREYAAVTLAAAAFTAGLILLQAG